MTCLSYEAVLHGFSLSSGRRWAKGSKRVLPLAGPTKKPANLCRLRAISYLHHAEARLRVAPDGCKTRHGCGKPRSSTHEPL